MLYKCEIYLVDNNRPLIKYTKEVLHSNKLKVSFDVEINK